MRAEAGVKPLICGGGTTVNEALLAPVPAGVVTLTGPLVAPAGTVAVTSPSESTAKPAGAPLKATPVAPANPAPLRVTLAPAGPEAGVKPSTRGGAGAATTVKEAALVAVPRPVVTLSLPLVAAAGTLVVSSLSESTVKLAAAPLKATPLASVKPSPESVTEVPAGPEVGVKEVMAGGRGAGRTVKELLLLAVPTGVVTLMRPVVAPLGTIARAFVSESTVKADAAVPLKAILVAPLKPSPDSVTEVPARPDEGANPEILGVLGAGRTVKELLLVPVPRGEVTEMGPVVAPDGTVTVIRPSETTL
jgi:hypothetical protein